MEKVAKPPAVDDVAATRARLIEAAGHIFASQGYQAATVREICSEAGANVAAVNYHFGDKMGLYTTVLRELTHSAQFGAIMQSLQGPGSPEERLRHAIAAMLHNLTSEVKGSRMMRIMAHELAAPTPALSQVVDEFIIPSQKKLCEVVGQILGISPRHEKTRLSAINIVGQILHFAKSRPVITRLWPRMKYSEKDIELIATHISNFTVAALRGMAQEETPNAH
jgi:TetR/AcrR family transcriptional regulator, regulator of cefoperazone and chloramphenicol sensitivity